MSNVNTLIKTIAVCFVGFPLLGAVTLVKAGEDEEREGLKTEVEALKDRLEVLEGKLAEQQGLQGAAPTAVTEEPSGKSAGFSFGDMLESSGIDINGYIDSSYTYLSGDGTFTSGVPNRVFDRDRNSFNLHLIDLNVAYQPSEGFGGLVNLSFGEDANVFGPIDTGLDDEFDIQQAFVQYARGPFTGIAGKFVTLAGAEVIKSPLNLNFTRSILFGYAIPFTHTGLRANYTFNDTTTFIAGVNNGWDVFEDDNSQKTIELGLLAKPFEPLALSLVGYSGNEAGLEQDGTRNLIDIVATYTVNDNLSLVLNYDWASQENALVGGDDADWSGIAGYINYILNEQWRLALRGEYFDDEDGFRTGIEQEWKEVTATLAYSPIKNVELRGEIRRDWSDEDSFVDTDGSADDSQYSIGLEAIYKFGL